MSLTKSLDDLTDTPFIHELYPQLKGELAFDVGANGGRVANILAPNFTRVIAFEPSEGPYRHLRTHHAENVKAMNCAVSDVNESIELERRAMSDERGYLFTGDSLPEWGSLIETVEVRAYTIDTLVNLYGVPDLIKVDTEGHEVRVVAGALETFSTQPQFIIEIHSEENGTQIGALLDRCGCRYREVRHEQHPFESTAWRNHYWLVRMEES